MRVSTQGWINGAIGMLIFSGSMPATRIAVGAFSPLFLTAARASIPGLLALVVLLAFDRRWPAPADLPRLALVALGVVLGFPIFTALALQYITSAHSLIWIGLLPLSTALFGVALAGERMRPAFWVFSGLGAACVMGFAASRATGGEIAGDGLMLLAVLSAGFGYAEGGRLSRRLGGWQVISWALLLALPFSAPLAFWLHPDVWPPLASPGWIALAYVAIGSMWIGFLFWYRGLALGGIASVGQLQLLQPVFGLVISAAVLHESVSVGTMIVAAAVVGCVYGAKRFA